MPNSNVIPLKTARSRLGRGYSVRPPAALTTSIPADARVDPDEEAEDRLRMRQNVAALVVISCIVVLGTWLIEGLRTYSRIQMCVEAGHRNCVPVDQGHQPSPYLAK
jgi:hypothetical protein